MCDEPVSSLDVSVRSSILNLLTDLRRELGLTLVFIAHDLALVRFLCDRIGVMYQGEMVELAGAEELFDDPQHHHTRELLAAQPVPDPDEEPTWRRMRRALALGETDDGGEPDLDASIRDLIVPDSPADRWLDTAGLIT